MSRLTEQDAIVQAVADYNANVLSANNSLAGAGQIQRLIYQYMAAGVTENPSRLTPNGRLMGYVYDNASFMVDENGNYMVDENSNTLMFG